MTTGSDITNAMRIEPDARLLYAKTCDRLTLAMLFRQRARVSALSEFRDALYQYWLGRGLDLRAPEKEKTR